VHINAAAAVQQHLKGDIGGWGGGHEFKYGEVLKYIDHKKTIQSFALQGTKISSRTHGKIKVIQFRFQHHLPPYPPFEPFLCIYIRNV